MFAVNSLACRFDAPRLNDRHRSRLIESRGRRECVLSVPLASSYTSFLVFLSRVSGETNYKHSH